ncbi:MAG: tetratricopeptide repeat protein [Acidobacteria bacterium]|nr:tetratricopeptide repeat protein [Acidobacteriota bacterium]
MTKYSTLLLIGTLLFAAGSKVDEARAKIKAGKHEDAIALLQAEHKAQPKNDEVRLGLANAYTEFGSSLMNNAQLPPFRKYPAALKQFRLALELDRDNKKAKDNIALIESIYKSMGREVPK